MRSLFLPVEKNHEYPSSPYIKEDAGALHLLCEFGKANKLLHADTYCYARFCVCRYAPFYTKTLSAVCAGEQDVICFYEQDYLYAIYPVSRFWLCAWILLGLCKYYVSIRSRVVALRAVRFCANRITIPRVFADHDKAIWPSERIVVEKIGYYLFDVRFCRVYVLPKLYVFKLRCIGC